MQSLCVVMLKTAGQEKQFEDLWDDPEAKMLLLF